MMRWTQVSERWKGERMAARCYAPTADNGAVGAGAGANSAGCSRRGDGD